jgi:5-formyltetrahydrofolate cyclo-ligase
MILDQQKKGCRDRAKAVRLELAKNLEAPLQLVQWAETLAQLSRGIVAGYYPKGSEIDVRPLMASLAQRGCRLALPVIKGADQPLEFRQWHPGDPLEGGPFGVMEPAATALVVRPALVLAPLLAFDRQGWRLGYGGGYYDRTLQLCPRLAEAGCDSAVVVVGVGFGGQEVGAVPHDDLDRPVDFILTETELIRA